MVYATVFNEYCTNLIVSILPGFAAAAYTYYWTKSQETSLKERGMYAERNCIRRRRERLLRVSCYLIHSMEICSKVFILPTKIAAYLKRMPIWPYA